MARHKNIDWKLPDKLETWDQLNAAILMDIRDELQRLNSLMHCSNVVDGFRALQQINKRMAKFDALKLTKWSKP